jgi:hypothetical protein
MKPTRLRSALLRVVEKQRWRRPHGSDAFCHRIPDRRPILILRKAVLRGCFAKVLIETCRSITAQHPHDVRAVLRRRDSRASRQCTAREYPTSQRRHRGPQEVLEGEGVDSDAIEELDTLCSELDENLEKLKDFPRPYTSRTIDNLES